MLFSDIEAKRAKAAIEQGALCRRAGVHFMTYSRLKNRPGKAGPTERTLRRLTDALDAMTSPRTTGVAPTTPGTARTFVTTSSYSVQGVAAVVSTTM